MSIKRTIVLSLEVEVSAYQDVSGMTPDELARAVWDAVEDERNDLATEARIAAIKLLAGEPLERCSAA